MKITFNPNLTPREQLAPYLHPAPCFRHPHILLPIDTAQTLEDTLYPYGDTYRDGRERFEAMCTAEYDFCKECKESILRFPAGCARHRETESKIIAVTADLVVEPVFRDWCNGIKPAVCERNGQQRTLPCLSTKLKLPRHELSLHCIYQSCIECNLEKLGVPSLFAGCTFDNYVCEHEKQSESLQTCRKFTSSFTGFLTLVGSNGTGKTHLGVAALRSFLESHRRKSARFIEFSALMAEQRRTYGNHDADDESEDDPVAGAGRLDLLVLDEMRFNGGNDEEPALFSLVNDRMDNFLPTILITNIPESEIKARLGSRIVDRINQASFATLSFNWPSHRPKANRGYLERASFLRKFPPG